MILKSINIKNFRKFQDSYIDFPDGVTGIIGLNGVGKSTIFEAIAWALYGPVAARTSSDQIKKIGTSSKDPCRIELEFIFADENYRIVREMTGKNLTASASATINGVLAANGAEIVSKFIQKKLGMDFKSFYTSIFAKQKELNALSSMNPSERKPLILRMLGINNLDDIIYNIRSDKKDKKDKIEKKRLELVDEKGENKHIRFLEEIKILKKKNEEIELFIKEINKDILSINKDYLKEKDFCDKKKNEYEMILKQKIEYDEKKIKYDKKKNLEEEIKILNNRFKERKENLQKQKIKLNKFNNIKIELEKLNTNQNQNNNAIENIIKKIEEKRIFQNQNKKEIKEINDKKIEIEKMGPKAKCPTCQRILDTQYNKLIDIYLKEINQKNIKINTLEKEERENNEQLKRLSKQKEALNKKNMYLHNRIIEIEKIKTTIINLTEENKKDEKNLKNKIKEIEKIKKIDFDGKKYSNLKNKVEESYKKYQISLQKINSIRDETEKLKLNKERKEGGKKLISQQIKNINENIEKQKNLIKDIKKETKQLQNLKLLDEIMISFRIYIISQIRPTISCYASELFEQLTDGKYSEIELDDNYNLIIYDNGYPYTIERFSGGEEDLANLCIRMAISEVITQRAGSMFNFIVLDEIFGSQDNIRKQNIIRALNKFSSKFRQIFLITHIEEVKNFIENTITVFEDESNISKIKIE